MIVPCIVCSDFEGTIEEVRQHQFNEHYEFYKLQYYDDNELVRNTLQTTVRRENHED